MVQLRFGARLCGYTELAIVKADIVSGFKQINACIGYKYKGKTINYLDVDTEELRNVKPIYKEFAGWEGDFSKLRKYADLPKNLRDYLEFIEKFVRVPVKIVSVGPRREQTILR